MNEWIEAKIITTSEGVEAASQILMEAGAAGVSIEDERDLEAFRESEGRWDYVDESVFASLAGEAHVKAYFPNDGRIGDIAAFIRGRLAQADGCDIDMGRRELTFTGVNEEDWANGWKKHFKPIKVGERLVICPTWEKYTPAEGETVLLLDPGMSFGTGTHETTRLCLRFIERLAKKGTSVLDIGTGSGILALAALALGADSALAIDIDAGCIKSATDNARANGLEGRLTARVGDLASGVSGRFDIVCANIIADAIIALAPDVGKHLAPGGAFIASGIIVEREQEVAGAIVSSDLEVREIAREGGWSAILAGSKP